jgi:hypothetical protein
MAMPQQIPALPAKTGQVPVGDRRYNRSIEVLPL